MYSTFLGRGMVLILLAKWVVRPLARHGHHMLCLELHLLENFLPKLPKREEGGSRAKFAYEIYNSTAKFRAFVPLLFVLCNVYTVSIGYGRSILCCTLGSNKTYALIVAIPQMDLIPQVVCRVGLCAGCHIPSPILTALFLSCLHVCLVVAPYGPLWPPP